MNLKNIYLHLYPFIKINVFSPYLTFPMTKGGVFKILIVYIVSVWTITLSLCDKYNRKNTIFRVFW